MQNIAFFSKTYDEAMQLLNATRDYIKWQQPQDIKGLSPYEALKVNCENTRITTRLMHVMAWMLLQKAIQAGEISAQEAEQEDFSLPMSEVYLSNDSARDSRLPMRLRELLEASRQLYVRVARLEQMGRDQAVISHQVH